MSRMPTNERTRRVVALLLCALTLAQAGPALAQTDGVDVAVQSISLDREPTVNVTTLVSAVVTATSAATVEVSFTYRDGTGIRDPGSVQGQGYRVSRVLPSGGSHVFSLEFDPVFERQGNQTLVVTARIQGQVDANASNDAAERPVFVRRPALNLSVDNSTALDVGEGMLRPVRVFVRNDGNANDTPVLTTSVTGPGWEAQATGTLPLIPPGASAIGYVLAKPTSGQQENPLFLNVTAHSTLDPDVAATAAAPILRVNESALRITPQPALQALAPRVEVFANETVNATFVLRNDGATPDVFTLNATLAPAGNLTVALALAATETNASTPKANESGSLLVALAPGESRTMVATLRANGTVDPDGHGLRILANATNDARLEALFGVRYAVEASARVVRATPDLSLSLAAPDDALYPSDEPRIEVGVANRGRMQATNASLELQLLDNVRVLHREVLPLAPLNGSASTHVTWTPPPPEAGGELIILARVIPGAGEGDLNESDNAARATLAVRSPLLIARGPPELTVVPGSRLLLSTSDAGLSVENRGTHAEFVVATLTGSAEWISARWERAVPAGATVPLPLDLAAPAHVGTAPLRASLHVAVASRPSFNDTLDIALRADDAQPPALSLASVPTGAVVGKDIEIAVDAEDATGVARVEAIILAPSGTRSSLRLDLVSPGATRYAASWRPSEEGAHEIEIRAEDATLGRLAANLTGIRVDVAASPYAGLVPDGFQAGAAVANLTLRFLEATPGTTASAQADVGTGWRELAPPYEVALMPREGIHEVRLRATSLDGTTWASTLNVTLDLTPPRVESVRSAPSGEGRLDFEVEAPDAADVRLRFETSRGPVEIPLSARSGGVFGGIVTPPLAWDAVKVVAYDEAGNFEASPVEETASTPLPPVALLLAAIAGLALARGGRRR